MPLTRLQTEEGEERDASRHDPPMTESASVNLSRPQKAPIFGSGFGKPQEGGTPFGKPQEGGTPFGKPQEGEGDKWNGGGQQQEATTPETTNSGGGSDAGRDGQDLREEGGEKGDGGAGKVFGGFKPGFLSPKSADGGGSSKSGAGAPLSPLLGNFRQGGGRGGGSLSPRGIQDSKESGGGGEGVMPQDPFAVLKDAKSREGGTAQDPFAGLKDIKSPFKTYDDDGKVDDETMGPFGKVGLGILPSVAWKALSDFDHLSSILLMYRVCKAVSSPLCLLCVSTFSLCSLQGVQVL